MIALEILVVIVLLALSAFFSGAEAAFFSLKKSSLARTKENERVVELLNQPRRLLITIITGNTLVNTFMAFLAALVTVHAAQRAGANVSVMVAIEAVVLAVVILLLSEITPKILAIRNSAYYARRISFPIKVVSHVLYPVASLLYNLTHFLTGWLPASKEELFDSEAELRALADLGADRGSLNEEERQMIKSVFNYGETAVREIMVPRIDIVAVGDSTTIQKAIQIVRESRFSKFPVYKKNIDTIEGILYAKDLLEYLDGKKNGLDILSLCREPFFVPESKQIDDLLKDFQRRRETVAIVVDEYGGTAGLVTVEDIVEEVVGDIRDEFDRELPLVVDAGEGKWIVDAKISINDLQEDIPIPFPDEREYDTLGGFLLEQFGDIPSAGSRTDLSNYRFHVRTVSEKRIIKVLVEETGGPDDRR